MDRVDKMELLRRANAAARVGETVEAKKLYQEITESDPNSVEAWLGLAGVQDDVEEKRASFETVLKLDPENEEARAALDLLERKQPSVDGHPQPATNVQEAEAEAVDEAVYCVNHPDTETVLRCNRCGRPVCTRCVELTEVGYRCKDCIRGQQAVYFTADTQRDYPIAFAAGVAIGAIMAPLILIFTQQIRFLLLQLLLAFFLGPMVGGSIAELIRRAVERRRGRYMGVVACGGLILGTLLGASLLNLALGAPSFFAALLTSTLNLGLILFMVLALFTVYARLR